MIFSSRANGKLLISAEYFVLDGATAFAIPTRLGQKIEVLESKEFVGIKWKSYDFEGQSWFEQHFDIFDFSFSEISDLEHNKLSENLKKIFLSLEVLQSQFFKSFNSGLEITTMLEFPRDWGLGSSSTLIALIAEWARVDPYKLLSMTFGGSGYDIAAAKSNEPFIFRLFNGNPQVEAVFFDPIFKNQLYFVYLNQKQDSREAMALYRSAPEEIRKNNVARISQITRQLLDKNISFFEFEKLLLKHEEIVKSVVNIPRAKEKYFSDFWGEIKSLGAWGGDFVLASSNLSEEKTIQYFTEKGFKTVIRYEDMAL